MNGLTALLQHSSGVIPIEIALYKILLGAVNRTSTQRERKR